MNPEALASTNSAAYQYDSLPTRSSLVHRLRNLDDDVSWRVFFDSK